jgi:hypothetical protein
VDVAVVVVLASNGWGDEPEEHVLDLKLKDRYNKSNDEIDSLFANSSPKTPKCFTYVISW